MRGDEYARRDTPSSSSSDDYDDEGTTQPPPGVAAASVQRPNRSRRASRRYDDASGAPTTTTATTASTSPSGASSASSSGGDYDASMLLLGLRNIPTITTTATAAAATGGSGAVADGDVYGGGGGGAGAEGGDYRSAAAEANCAARGVHKGTGRNHGHNHSHNRSHRQQGEREETGNARPGGGGGSTGSSSGTGSSSAGAGATGGNDGIEKVRTCYIQDLMHQSIADQEGLRGHVRGRGTGHQAQSSPHPTRQHRYHHHQQQQKQRTWPAQEATEDDNDQSNRDAEIGPSPKKLCNNSRSPSPSPSPSPTPNARTRSTEAGDGSSSDGYDSQPSPSQSPSLSPSLSPRRSVSPGLAGLLGNGGLSLSSLSLGSSAPLTSIPITSGNLPLRRSGSPSPCRKKASPGPGVRRSASAQMISSIVESVGGGTVGGVAAVAAALISQTPHTDKFTIQNQLLQQHFMQYAAQQQSQQPQPQAQPTPLQQQILELILQESNANMNSSQKQIQQLQLQQLLQQPSDLASATMGALFPCHSAPSLSPMPLSSVSKAENSHTPNPSCGGQTSPSKDPPSSGISSTSSLPNQPVTPSAPGALFSSRSAPALGISPSSPISSGLISHLIGITQSASGSGNSTPASAVAAATAAFLSNQTLGPKWPTCPSVFSPPPTSSPPTSASNASSNSPTRINVMLPSSQQPSLLLPHSSPNSHGSPHSTGSPHSPGSSPLVSAHSPSQSSSDANDPSYSHHTLSPIDSVETASDSVEDAPAHPLTQSEQSITIKCSHGLESVTITVPHVTPQTTVGEFMYIAQALLQENVRMLKPDITMFIPLTDSESVKLGDPILQFLGEDTFFELLTQDEMEKDSSLSPRIAATQPHPSSDSVPLPTLNSPSQPIANEPEPKPSPPPPPSTVPVSASTVVTSDPAVPAAKPSAAPAPTRSPTKSTPVTLTVSNGTSQPRGRKKAARQPFMFEYTMLEMADGGRRVAPNTSCHRCKTRKPQCLVCPQNDKHKFCLVCLERHHNTVTIPATGCPLCTQSCTCAMCRKKY
ncbi:hypothetical protein Pelo_5800 [Pelomyxa schiedti]|nr:hypothetical protein Pelo_5800 [Pelomyxa schiedti]